MHSSYRSKLIGLVIAFAASNIGRGSALEVTASDRPWTIVTVAPDGSWGVGNKPHLYLAIAEAVTNCRRMYRASIGCGAQLEAI